MKKYYLDGRTATDHFPGIGRYVSNLARALVPLLNAAESLVIIRDPSSPSRWVLPPASGRVTWLDLPVSTFGPAQQWKVPSVLKDASVYHSPYYMMPYRPGVPTVLTVYDLIPQFFPHMFPLQVRALYGLAHRFALRAADRVICISDATARDFREYYGLDPQRAAAIPLAPDTKFAPSDADAIQDMRSFHRLDGGFVLYVGINKPHKNLTGLVKAWANVKTDLPLVIGGAWDPRYPQVKETIASLGMESRVKLIGPVTDEHLRALYSACTLFVFPSLYEGFGLPVIEAMACGAAVACGNSSSLPEAAGEAGVLFDGRDTEAIAAVLQTLLDDPERLARMRRKSAAQAAKFTWEQNAAATLEIYRALAE